MTDAEALAMTRLNYRRTIVYVLNVSKFKRKKNDTGERILYLKRAYKGEERKRFYI